MKITANQYFNINLIDWINSKLPHQKDIVCVRPPPPLPEDRYKCYKFCKSGQKNPPPEMELAKLFEICVLLSSKYTGNNVEFSCVYIYSTLQTSKAYVLYKRGSWVLRVLIGLSFYVFSQMSASKLPISTDCKFLIFLSSFLISMNQPHRHMFNCKTWKKHIYTFENKIKNAAGYL